MIAIDPGNERSAYVVYFDGVVLDADIVENNEMLNRLRATLMQPMYIEMVASYGMAVGKTVFDTCVWIGRFEQAWRARGMEVHKVYRKDVKLHLCGQTRAKDANIRQALIDKFGPGKDKAIGKKKNPGPLYGFKADMWAALAVAVTADETSHIGKGHYSKGLKPA